MTFLLTYRADNYTYNHLSVNLWVWGWAYHRAEFAKCPETCIAWGTSDLGVRVTQTTDDGIQAGTFNQLYFQGKSSDSIHRVRFMVTDTGFYYKTLSIFTGPFRRTVWFAESPRLKFTYVCLLLSSRRRCRYISFSVELSTFIYIESAFRAEIPGCQLICATFLLLV